MSLLMPIAMFPACSNGWSTDGVHVRMQLVGSSGSVTSAAFNRRQLLLLVVGN